MLQLPIHTRVHIRSLTHAHAHDADWEAFVTVIAANILEEQTPKRLLDVRAQFYDLLVPLPTSTPTLFLATNSFPLPLWVRFLHLPAADR